MYSDVFCKVYNEFGWNYYPEIFGEQLMAWMGERGFEPKTALDLACGTGILCERLADQGITVRGMDLSQGMIAIARESRPELAYEVADMVTYRPAGPFDLVTCTGDALNHIPMLSDLQTIFENIHGYLAPGGWLVFDLLRQSEVSDSEPFEMDYDDRTRVWFQMTRPTAETVNLKIRVFEEDILQFEENIAETLRDPELVCRMLSACGFRSITCADRLLPSSRPGTTWFVTAQK